MGDTPPSFGAAKEIPTYIRDTSCNNNIDRGSQSKLPRSFKIQQQPPDPASSTRGRSARREPCTTFTAHAVCTARWMDGWQHHIATLVAIWTRRRSRNTKRRSSRSGVSARAPATATPQHSIASSYRTVKSPNSKANNYNMRRTHCN